MTLRLLAVEALLAHLPPGNNNRAPIEDEHAKILAGWRGEQNLAYYLDTLPLKNHRIFYDLREHVLNRTFQMNAFLMTETFALIMEVKNFSGILQFEPGGRQLWRFIGERREGFSNPLIQMHRHCDMLSAWLTAHHLPKIPIESLVVISSSSTIIDNPSHLQEVSKKVIHAEQIRIKIDQLSTQYAHRPSILNTASVVEHLLLEEHTDPPFDILNKFNICPADLRRGVRCPHCHLFGMKRVYLPGHAPAAGTPLELPMNR